MRYSTHTENTFNNLPINQANENESREPILAKISQLLAAMTSQHSKLVVVRLDIRYPSNWIPQPTDRNFEQFINSFIQYLTRRKFNAKYCWAKEQNDSINPHMHLALILDGNVFWNFTEDYLLKANTLWCNALQIPYQPLIHHCQPQQINNLKGRDIYLERNSSNFQEQYEQTFEYISYLAKCRTKDNLGNRKKSFGYSQRLS